MKITFTEKSILESPKQVKMCHFCGWPLFLSFFRRNNLQSPNDISSKPYANLTPRNVKILPFRVGDFQETNEKTSKIHFCTHFLHTFLSLFHLFPMFEKAQGLDGHLVNTQKHVKTSVKFVSFLCHFLSFFIIILIKFHQIMTSKPLEYVVIYPSLY